MLLNDYKVFAVILSANVKTIIKEQNFMKIDFKQEKDDDYLLEFRQKIANQRQEEIEQRQNELYKTRNGFIGTLAGIVLAGIVGWVLLIPQTSETETKEIPVIRRPISPVKIKPSEPGGMNIPNQDKSIYELVEKKEIAPEKVESLLPQPEAPKMPTISPEPEIITDTKKPEELQTKPNQNDTETLSATNLDELIDAVQSNAQDKIDIPEKVTDINANIRKAEPKKEEPKKEEPKKEEPKVKKVDSENKAPATIKKSEPIQEKTETKGNWQIQLIASANRTAVEKSWESLSSKYSFIKNLPHSVETAKINSGSEIYRLKAGNFSSREEADKICKKIKDSGGSCLIKNN